jgi:transcriptional regulator with XRE-family HTH domain
MQSEKTFGEFIREKRESKRFSLREFARWCDMSNGYLSNIEQGKVPAPKDNILVKMAQILVLTDYEKAVMKTLALKSMPPKIVNAKKIRIPKDVIDYVASHQHIWDMLRAMSELQVTNTECVEFITKLIDKRNKIQEIQK